MLVENMMTKCVKMIRKKTSDGEGGTIVEWQEGPELQIAIVNDTSLSARVAQQEGVSSTYTLTTTRENALEYHEVVKRLEDGAVFRVTSEGADKLSPAFSTLNISQVSAEKWSLNYD